MGRCRICGDQSPLISSQLGVCLQCIRDKPEEALKITDKVHAESRGVFGLPPKPPRDTNGISCGVCSNDCKIGEGEKGFCGLVFNKGGRLVRMGGTAEKGILQWYYDPLPTNCVAWWFCPGCTGAGYPKYAYKRGAEMGYANLAVFYGACSLDCLHCQNWHYRNLAAKLGPVMSAESLAAKADSHVSCICYEADESCPKNGGKSSVVPVVSAEGLAAKVDPHVSCICFFGGDPSVQMPHALKTSRVALERARAEGWIFRVCWETNGYWKKEFGLQAAELSLVSGGVVKFDLKTWDENLNRALCGVSNKPTLDNFRVIGEAFYKKRPDLPVLTASTLLIPGYVDDLEVGNIARFIAEIDQRIPYSLLAFCPHYVMSDLPTTSRRLAHRCFDVAKKHLKNVRLGNIHLLS